MDSHGERVSFGKYGVPVEVLEVVQESRPLPGSGEVLLEMLAAPVNPADINFVQGNYGIRPELPATPGAEGVGRVVELGEGVDAVALGDLVVPLGWLGTWRRFLVVPSPSALVVPKSMPIAFAAQLRVNPMTAWRMLKESGAKKGDWVALNAGNSAVGLALVQVAKQLGIRTLVVARSEQAQKLCSEYGATLVDEDSREGYARLKEAVGTERALAGFNAVGGDSAIGLMDLLVNGGTLFTYGAMSQRPLKVPNSFLIFRGLVLRGFWLSAGGKEEVSAAVLNEYREMIAACPEMTLPVDSEFALHEVAQAIARSEESRKGKVLLRLGGEKW